MTNFYKLGSDDALQSLNLYQPVGDQYNPHFAFDETGKPYWYEKGDPSMKLKGLGIGAAGGAGVGALGGLLYDKLRGKGVLEQLGLSSPSSSVPLGATLGGLLGATAGEEIGRHKGRQRLFEILPNQQ